MAASVQENRWFDVLSLSQLFDGAQKDFLPSVVPTTVWKAETQIPNDLQFAQHSIHLTLLYKLRYKKKNYKSLQ